MFKGFLFLHLTGVIIWVGGMFFAYFCLRPAAGQLLEPPQRLPLWTATFKPFFRYTAISVALIILSGFGMMGAIKMGSTPHGWLLMMALGLVMAIIFVYVYWALYPKLSRNSAAGAWPVAGAVLGVIRRLVALNLFLALLVIAAAVSAR